MAPELLEPTSLSCEFSKKTDVHAFSMVAIEVFTGTRAFCKTDTQFHQFWISRRTALPPSQTRVPRSNRPLAGWKTQETARTHRRCLGTPPKLLGAEGRWSSRDAWSCWMPSERTFHLYFIHPSSCRLKEFFIAFETSHNLTLLFFFRVFLPQTLLSVFVPINDSASLAVVTGARTPGSPTRFLDGNSSRMTAQVHLGTQNGL
jgi:hypothetical protein